MPDRLLHHAQDIMTTSDSYRLRERERMGVNLPKLVTRQTRVPAT